MTAPRTRIRETVTETDIANRCDALANTCGWTVERYEQRRATRITEGLPDRRYVHAGRQSRVWVELKRPGGKLTRAQHAWLESELMAGGLATVIDDAGQLARLLALLTRDSSVGRAEAHRRCRELVYLVALRGFRQEAA